MTSEVAFIHHLKYHPLTFTHEHGIGGGSYCAVATCAWRKTVPGPLPPFHGVTIVRVDGELGDEENETPSYTVFQRDIENEKLLDWSRP